MTEKSWREYAISHIYHCLIEYEVQSVALGEEFDSDACLKWIRKDKYPFGMRQYSPYNIWLEECKHLKTFLATKQQSRLYHSWRMNLWGKKRNVQLENPDQMSLLG